MKVAVEFKLKQHRGKLVDGAFVHVIDPKGDDPNSVYAAILTSTVELKDRKAHVTYVNDVEERNDEVEMVFAETEPVNTGTVWLRDIQYIMPTGRVKKKVIEGAEDAIGNPKHEWCIDIQAIPSVDLSAGDLDMPEID